MCERLALGLASSSGLGAPLNYFVTIRIDETGRLIEQSATTGTDGRIERQPDLMGAPRSQRQSAGRLPRKPLKQPDDTCADDGHSSVRPFC